MWRTFGGFVLLLLVAALGWFLLMQPTSETSADPGDRKKPPRDEFASDRDPKAPTPAKSIPFDGKRAMEYLEKVCDIGPRISGSDGMAKQQELLDKHFTELGLKVELQKFTARQNSKPKPVEMANLIARWKAESERRVILCSHYDTRPLADQEPDPRKWTEPFVSANDGGSGVALLMELAHHLKEMDPAVGVDLVFFDGEEYVFERRDQYFLGSQHFGVSYKRGKPKYKYTAAILLDMVGGKGATFPIEQNSNWSAPLLVAEVWKIAAEQRATAFVPREGAQVDDDHIALNRNGIPAIDIIDFSYKHWHRLSDTPDRCSAESLEQVAKVLAVWLQRQK
jgi:glutaminyl-peptide cyclotransferase